MVRTCFRSRWRLIENRPDIQTLGRFFRVPPTTPALPLPHYFWSRDWVSDYVQDGVELGEWPGPRKYDKGVAPPNFSEPVIVGDAHCITDGEKMLPPDAPAVPPPDFQLNDLGLGEIVLDGIPFFQEDCHPTPKTGLQRRVQFLNHTIQPPAVAAALIRAIKGVYDKSEDARTILKHLMGPWTAESQNDPDDGYFPGSAIVVGPNCTIVACSGTTNWRQWYLQIVGSPGPLLVRPNYRTFTYWEATGQLILNRLKLTGDSAKKPILLAGHSLGGASATICAAKLLEENPDRDVRLLTFGSPKVGNIVLRNWLGEIPQLHFVNPADPVPFTPLDRRFNVFWGLPNVFAPWVRWDEYVSLRPTVWIDGNGNYVDVTPETIPFALLARFMKAMLQGGDPDPGIPHYVATYLAALGG